MIDNIENMNNIENNLTEYGNKCKTLMELCINLNNVIDESKIDQGNKDFFVYNYYAEHIQAHQSNYPSPVMQSPRVNSNAQNFNTYNPMPRKQIKPRKKCCGCCRSKKNKEDEPPAYPSELIPLINILNELNTMSEIPLNVNEYAVTKKLLEDCAVEITHMISKINRIDPILANYETAQLTSIPIEIKAILEETPPGFYEAQMENLTNILKECSKKIDTACQNRANSTALKEEELATIEILKKIDNLKNTNNACLLKIKNLEESGDSVFTSSVITPVRKNSNIDERVFNINDTDDVEEIEIIPNILFDTVPENKDNNPADTTNAIVKMNVDVKSLDTKNPDHKTGNRNILINLNMKVRNLIPLTEFMQKYGLFKKGEDTPINSVDTITTRQIKLDSKSSKPLKKKSFGDIMKKPKMSKKK